MRGPNEDLIRNQLRCIQAVDDGAGMIFKALEETGQLDNTVIIYTSDNGYFWGEHGLGDKRWSYEESIRDPLLIRYPKLVKAGMKVDRDALNVDIAPTVLDLAGVRVPSNMHGRSLVPLLAGKSAAWRNAFLIEYFAEKNFPRVPTWQGVRTARWKYTHYTDLQGMDELYDLQGRSVRDEERHQRAVRGGRAEGDEGGTGAAVGGDPVARWLGESAELRSARQPEGRRHSWARPSRTP